MNDRALESVILAVREHGLPCVTHGEYCEVDGGNLWIRPDVYIKGEGEGGARLVLEIKAVSHQIGDSPILEAFAGSGATVEAAINQAFGKFLLGSFHVLIEALTSHKCETEQAEIEEWVGEDKCWTVYSGPLITQHSSDSLIGPDFPAFFAQLQNLFEKEVPSGPHWVRVFLAVMEGEVVGGEVLLNNETWEAAQRMLLEFPWKCSEEYQTLRHFMLALSGVPESLQTKSHEAKRSWWKFW